MKILQRVLRLGSLLLAAFLLAGCAGWMGAPQQRLVNMPAKGGPHVHIVDLMKGKPFHEYLVDPGICIDFMDPDCLASLPANRDYAVEVKVNDTQAPVILGLSGFYRIQWRLHLAPGVHLQKILLVGYNPQTLEGVPANVPVERRFFGQHFCGACFLGHAYFYNLTRPAPIFHDLIKHPITSFQGGFSADEIVVNAPGSSLKPP